MSSNPVIKEIKAIRAETKRLATGEVVALRLLNNAGVSLVSGDVVVLDTTTASAVKLAAAAGDDNPMVVYQGGVAGEYLKALNTGVIMQITCDGPAIAIGDLIVASATARYGRKKVVDTDGILGVAVQAKADAITASVRVLLMPGGSVSGGGGGGTVESASNIGAGVGVFSALVGTDLQFKSLLEGAGIDIAADADEITITNTDLGSGAVATHEGTYDHSLLHEPVTLGAGGLSAHLGLIDQELTLSDIAHSELTDLLNDDHTQYILAEPAATDTAIVLFDGVSGREVKEAPVLIDAAGIISGVEAIQFNLAPTVVHTEGQLYWDDDDKTLTMDTEAADVSLQIGQENWIRCRNVSGSTILNGTLVYVTGASGFRPTIAPAIASDAAQAFKLIGMTTHDIVDAANGYVTILGLVRDVNTDPGTYTEGQSLYLSDTVAGAYTNVQPTKPHSIVRIGSVMKAHATEGIIGIRITPAVRIEDISDADLTSGLADGAILYYDAPGGGVDPEWVPSDGLVNVYSGAVVFNEDGNDTDFQVNGRDVDNLIFVNAATNRVGLGTTTPDFRLDVEDSAENTIAKFGGSLPVYIINNDAAIGFNAYYDAGAWRYGAGSSSNYAALMELDPTSGVLSYYNSPAAGDADAAVTFKSRFAIGLAELTINEDGEDCDFRVESNLDTSALFVDASADAVGIRNSAPVFPLDVGTTLDTTGAKVGDTYPVYIGHNRAFVGWNLYYGSSSWRVGKGSVSKYGFLAQLDQDNGFMGFYTSDAVNEAAAATMTERMRIGLTETVINDGGNDYDFRAEGDTVSDLFLVDASDDMVRIAGSSVQLPGNTVEVYSGYCKKFTLFGWKFSQADNTLFDAFTFTIPSATAGSQRYGSFNGELTVSFQGRTTGGNARRQFQRYWLYVSQESSNTISATLTLLSDASTGVTFTCQVKAGATSTAIIIEMKATYASWDSTYNHFSWNLRGMSVCDDQNHLLTPTNS